jgi:hypothetical protein
MLASVLDGAALLQVLWVSVVAGLGLTLAFSLAIAAGARAGQARRAGASATGWYAATIVCGALCTAAVVLGVAVMLSK